MGGAWAASEIVKLDQLAKKTIAVPRGTMADQLVQSKYPGAKIVYFDTVADGVASLKSSEVDAVAYDEPVLRYFLRANKELHILPGFITENDYAIAINPADAKLKNTVDSRIAELQASGELEKMDWRWFAAVGEAPPISAVELPARGETQWTVAVNSDVAPCVFEGPDGKVTGYDIDLVGRIATLAGSRLEIKKMAFDELIPAVASGKVDMAVACLTVSPERSKVVLFSQPYYKGGIAAMVKK